MGLTLTALRFYWYGRGQFTATGYLENSASFEPSCLEKANLKSKVFAVTGANSGIGCEVTRFLASKGAHVLMICRSKERAEPIRNEIVKQTGNTSVEVLVCDVSLVQNVRNLAATLKSKVRALDCLVCNAGALLNERTETSEGLEVTFAAHLLCGTYLLTEELLPLLKKAADPRVVIVSSGGMYTVPYDHARSVDPSVSYDGQLAYANAKRGQVLLAERWAAQPEKANLKIVSCHPGWTDTPGVDSAYAGRKSWLEPLRTLWQGSDGICWLCVASGAELEGGAFYLDRAPQEKHLDGTIGSLLGGSTWNTDEEIERMMAALASLSQSAGQR